MSARDWLTPLAILVPIGLTPAAFVWMARVGVFAWLVFPVGLAAAAVAGTSTYGVRTALVAAISTWLALLVARNAGLLRDLT
ncbi:MAG TPA: hypothetical protein VGK69_07725 [Gaiellaceae bacterium]